MPWIGLQRWLMIFCLLLGTLALMTTMIVIGSPFIALVVFIAWCLGSLTCEINKKEP